MPTVTLSTDVLFQTLDEETILLNMSSGIYFGLDPVGARIWSLLAETGDSETALAHILAEYDVDETTLRKDIDRLLTELADAGLLVIGASETAGT